MSAQDTNTIRRLIQELWNNKSLSIAEQILTSDSRNIDPNTPEFGAGPDAYKKLATTYTNAFPDLRLTIDEMIAEGDKIALRWTASGTHKGELRGILPTGKKMEISTGITICRLSNGKIAEQWVAWNALGLLQKLGAASAMFSIVMGEMIFTSSAIPAGWTTFHLNVLKTGGCEKGWQAQSEIGIRDESG